MVETKKRTTAKKIRPLLLACVIFFTVSGGPYGLEPLLQYAGDHASLLLLVTVPFLWDIPAILTVLELNSMMPINGGYYKWVRHALGNRWGFYEGLWTWFYTFVDLAIYPVLFVQYASYLFPGLDVYKIPVCLVIIWSSAMLNIAGIVPVGKISSLLSVLVIMPFIILFVLFFCTHTAGPLPSPSFHGVAYPSLGLALYTIMWNFLGWDNVTTYAEEVENPVRSYLISIVIAFITILVMYVLVMFVAQQSGINHADLTTKGFPALAALISGHWLGVLIAGGGMASTLGIYNANLLSVSRLPKVMADDKLLPGALSRLHPTLQTPYISILVCSMVVSLMVLWTFADLLIIDVTIYGAGLFLEYFSLIKLRVTAPDMHRPFKIPLNVPALVLLIALPIIIYFIALTGVCLSTGDAAKPAFFAIIVLLIPELVWRIMIWRRPEIQLMK
ncbi:MAG: APC family permease [Flavipsychrobacter sp.]|nr:APC family permease [Flavipsychrobacter sp.]